MKVLVTAVHPTTRSDAGHTPLAAGELVGWHIKWNGVGSPGAFYPEPMQPMSVNQAQTIDLPGGENSPYTVAIEWFDQYGQKSIFVLPTVTLHAPTLPAPPDPGTGSAVVVP
jgi:hypothetical protein